MAPITMATASAIGAGMDFIGGLFSNRASAKAADKQMQFQERMSNTAYQRSMADMKQAGLNPILAYQRGGASSPGGSQPNIRNPAERASQHASAYTAAKVADANIRNINANTALTAEKANTERLVQQKTISDTNLADANTIFTGQKTETEVANTQMAWDKITGILVDNDIKMSQATLANVMNTMDAGLRKGKVSETLRWIELNLGITGKDALDLIKWAKQIRSEGAVPRTTTSERVTVNPGGGTTTQRTRSVTE